MPSDCDVALLGTGVAPLLAASTLLAEGKSVLLLNPEYDFFSENSELPLDPLWPAAEQGITLEQLRQSLPEEALQYLRPHFPGAVELWPVSGSSQGGTTGYRDRFAPHVRTRQRLWVQSRDHLQRTQRVQDWQEIEDLYLRAADAGLNPQSLEGLQAYRRFPGSSATRQPPSGNLKGILIPKLSDVDVPRYRNGLREFIRDRMDTDRVVTQASQIELTFDGIRYRSGGSARTALLREGLMVFWTPRLTQWVLSQAKKFEVTPKLPRGVRIWEDWSVVSREPIDPSIIGCMENMVAWAEVEGAPEEDREKFVRRLAVLRGGTLFPLNSRESASAEASTWASADSFRSLSRLCHDYLGWENYTVRSVRPRAILEWDQSAQPESFLLMQGSYTARVICGGDGPLVQVARTVRNACRDFDLLRLPQ
jgi:hypothetical protein